MDDLRRLRVLREFRERRTVTATAAALHLTPSAVSQQLAGLARGLGFAVLERDGRGMVLTPRGRALLAHADSVFAQIERARHDLESWDEDPRGTATVGAFSSAITGLLPDVLAGARQAAPRLTIRLREAEAPAVFDQLDAGQVDIAVAVRFTGSPGPADPRYHHVDLGVDELDVALPADHPLAATDRVRLRDLETDPWIAGDPTGCCGAITATACAAAGFVPDVVYRVNDWHAVAQLVAGGHGVALVPRLTQPGLPPTVAVRPTTGQSPQRRIFAAVTEGAQDSPLAGTVLALLRGATTTRTGLGRYPTVNR